MNLNDSCIMIALVSLETALSRVHFGNELNSNHFRTRDITQLFNFLEYIQIWTKYAVVAFKELLHGKYFLYEWKQYFVNTYSPTDAVVYFVKLFEKHLNSM